MKQVVLYGLGEAKDNYRALRYYIMQAEHMDEIGRASCRERV